MKHEIAELLEKFKSEPTPQAIPENFAELLFAAMRGIEEEEREMRTLNKYFSYNRQPDGSMILTQNTPDIQVADEILCRLRDSALDEEAEILQKAIMVLREQYTEK